METSIYIGNNKLDYNEAVNCEYSIMDFREFQSGSNNTSYTINLPLTDLNRKLLKYSDSISTIDEVLEDALIFVDDIQILKGKLKVLACADKYIKVIISANEYLKGLEDKTLQDLVTTSLDFTHTSANIIASWSASSGAFYRYPFVNYVYRNNYLETDLIPYFNLKTILDYIFATIGFTINSTFLTSTWFKDLYITPKEFINDTDFSENWVFNYHPSLNSDNYYQQAIAAGASGIVVSFTCDPIVNNTATTSNTNYNSSLNAWTCPKSGTYKFESVIGYNLQIAGLDLIASTCTFAIKRNGNTIASDTTAMTSTTSRTLTTRLIHCEDGDTIETTLHVTQTVNNTTGISINATQYLSSGATYFKMVDFTEDNLYYGRDYPLKVNQWLQDTSLIDFVSGVKQLFNLCFFVDNWNKIIYIEPFQTFIGSSVNIINDVEYMSKSKEFISKDWPKKLHIDFKDDSLDYILQEYNKKNLTKSGRKTVNLNSIYNKNEIETYENGVFSTFGQYNYLSVYSDLDNRTFRIKEFNTKICHWDGLASGNWTFEGVAYTNYPKVSFLDSETLYSSYFAKYFHLIDQGVMVTITAPTDLIILTQLNTVINTAANEGFRALYQFDYEGETHLGILQSAVTDGYKTKYTLLLIK